MDDKDRILQCLRHLASVCDYARTLDGQGFNGFDADFGHDLAGRDCLSDGQAIVACKMLQKYRKQLETAGLSIPESYITEKIKDEPKIVKRIEVNPVSITGSPVIITRTNGDLLISFPVFDGRNIRVEKIKSLPERRWCPELPDKPWKVPNRLAREVVAMFPEAKVDQSVLDLIDAQNKLSEMSEQANGTFRVSGLGGELYPFQQMGVKFLDCAGGRAILADEMGLGKTVQALAYLQHRPELRPAVIVCPASLKQNWFRELRKWLKINDTVKIIDGREAYDLSLEGVAIIIINWDILDGSNQKSSWKQKIIDWKPAIVIADEAHYMKNRKAIRSKAMQEIANAVPRVILMTGTPVTNRPSELFPLLNAVDSRSWPNFFRYAKRYCNAHQTYFGWDFSGASNLDELHEIIKPYVMRRLKSQVLKDLPAKRRATVELKFDDYLLNDYEDALEAARDVIERKGTQAEHLVMIEKAKQICVKAKLPAVRDWVFDSFIETGEKVVLFATHHETIDILMKSFGDVAVKLDGRDNDKSRQEAIDRFQNDPSCLVFVGNIKAAGVGITLTAASNVAFVEFAWTPGDMTQAEDRIHRIGQEESVTAWYLVASGTIDVDIVNLLESKRQVIDVIHDGSVSDVDFSIVGEIVKIISQGIDK